MKGRQDLYRLPIGDYRAIYAIEDKVVYVTDLFHRGKGYD
jgi:mRNA-degrading endonuclease RelE of RelBE toxin-antitoxin system